MAPRITYRRTTAWNTRSNKIRTVRTPGGKLVAQHIQKRASRPICPVCKKFLTGIKALRPTGYRHISQHKRSVSRAYGGNLCGNCLKDRIVRAFMIEEVKVVKRVMNASKK
jgi:large subunit ribosomal protein L34e